MYVCISASHVNTQQVNGSKLEGNTNGPGEEQAAHEVRKCGDVCDQRLLHS